MRASEPSLPGGRASAVRVRGAAMLALWVYLLALAAGPHHFLFWREWGLQLFTLGLIAAYLWLRIAQDQQDRVWRLGLAGWVTFFLIGNAILCAHLGPELPPLLTRLSMVSFLLCYPCAMVATLQLFRGGGWRPEDRGSLLDALVATVSVWAMFSAVVLPAGIEAARTGHQPVIFVLLLPVCDLTMLSITLAAICFGVSRPRTISGWLLLAVAIFGLADSTYAVRIAQGDWTFGTLLDGAWVVGTACAALGAGSGPPLRPRWRSQDGAVLTVPLAGAGLAILLLAVGTQMSMTPAAVALSVLAAGIALLRLADAHVRLAQLGRTRQLAMTDDLTGLMNRRAFGLEVDQMVALPGAAPVAVLLVDLDRFKEVNDRYGHAAGDRLLRAIALRMESAVPEGGLIARLGGDEFAAVIPISAERAVEDLAGELHDSATAPVLMDGRVLQVGASIGVSLFPQHGLTRSELLHCADVAMYRAKRTTSGVQVYDPGAAGPASSGGPWSASPDAAMRFRSG